MPAARGQSDDSTAPRTTARRFWPAALAIAVLAAGGGAWSLRETVARSLARRHVARAERMLASGDEASARAELDAAVEDDPLHPGARRLRGELYLRQHLLEQAFLDLQAYSDAFPEDPKGWSDLAEIRLRASQPAQAEAALTKAIDLAPGHADLRQRRAELRRELGHHYGALVDGRAALGRDGGGAAGATGLEAVRLLPAQCAGGPGETTAGEAESWPGELGPFMRDFAAATRRKDWARATDLVRAAGQRYPRTMLGPWLDGVSSLAFGDLDVAERRLRDALAVSPRSHRPVTNLVALWSRQHGPAYTGNQLVRMVEHDPAFAYPLPIAAAAYVEADQPAKAEATIRRIFDILPQSPVPYREVTRFLLQLDRASDAIATASDGLGRFPADTQLFLEQARAFAALGDREAAIRAYGQAMAACPDDHRASAQLARLLVTARKDATSRERALGMVRHLECDAPSDPDVLGAMGLVLLEAADDAAGARRWLEAARDRAPDSPQLRYRLALAYARTRDVAGARRELRQALQSGLVFEEEPEARRLLERIGDAP